MNRSNHSRMPILHRVLTVAAAGSVFFFCAPAMGQSSQTEPPAVPILKGGYVLTDVQNCVSGEGNFSQLTGLASFDPSSGTLKLDGYSASGDPLTLSHVKQSLSYSNSASTITFGDSVYQVTYGRLEKGIATYLSLIAADGTCASQIWLARQ